MKHVWITGAIIVGWWCLTSVFQPERIQNGPESRENTLGENSLPDWRQELAEALYLTEIRVNFTVYGAKVLYLTNFQVAELRFAPLPANEFDRLSASAGQGDSEAQLILALYTIMQPTGDGLYPALAVRWLEQAANQGHPLALNMLAKMYFQGVGVPQDVPVALSWLKRASVSGDALTLTNQGLLYESGAAAGVPKDPVLAMQYFQQAADAGDRIAALKLGVAYAEGAGVPVDPVACQKWLQVAYDAGLDIARVMLDSYILQLQRAGTG